MCYEPSMTDVAMTIIHGQNMAVDTKEEQY